MTTDLLKQYTLSTFAHTLEIAKKIIDDNPDERFAEIHHDNAKHAANSVWRTLHCMRSSTGTTIPYNDA